MVTGHLIYFLSVVCTRHKLRVLPSSLTYRHSIINKKSSARLWKDQQTEDEIGLSFDDLDAVLAYLDKRKDNAASNFSLKDSFPLIPPDKINHILSLIKKSEHKFSFPPICNLN